MKKACKKLATVLFAILSFTLQGSVLSQNLAQPSVLLPQNTKSATEIESDITNVTLVLHGFYQDIFDAFQIPYEPVPISTTSTVCEPKPNNAHFCSADRSIYYDSLWFEELFNLVGDSSVYFLLAHEYGHSFIHDLKWDLSALENELLSDCLAAAFIWHSGQIVVEPGDEDEIYVLMYEIGDPDSWLFDPETAVHYNHGSAMERSKAVNIGREQGYEGCTHNAGGMATNRVPTDNTSSGGSTSGGSTPSVSLPLGAYQLQQLEVTVFEIGNGAYEAAFEDGSTAQFAPRSVAPQTTFEQVISEWNPDITLLETPVDISTSFAHLSGSTHSATYEQPLNNELVHGFITVNIQSSGQAVIVDVFAKGASTTATDWEGLAERSARILANLSLTN